MGDEADVDRQNIRHIFETMIYGEDEPQFSYAWDWVIKHNRLPPWIDGKYVQIGTPGEGLDEDPPEGFLCGIPVPEGEPFAGIAIVSSVTAQAKWINLSSDSRQERIYKLSKLLQSNSELITQLCNLDEEEFDMIIDYFNFCADLSIDKWESVGTVLIKLSSDTPPWVCAMHVASALAGGCSVIINPSPKACFFSFALAEICEEVGLPKGLVNVVPGGKKTYQEFLKGNIQKIIYNGHLDGKDFAGYKIPRHLAVLTPHHTAFVLLESCDVRAALDKLFFETWKNVGKTIWGVGTLVIQEPVYCEFLRGLARKIKSCQINFAANIRLHNTLADAVQMGAKVVHYPDEDDKLVPMVLSQHHLEYEDLPIITMMACRTTDEAITLVNGSPYCVGTSVWTENYAQALQVSSQLDSSIIWINCHGTLDATISFEPSRKSGVGSFGGLEGVLENRSVKPMESNPGESECQEYNLDAENLSRSIRASSSCLRRWRRDKNRKKYLKDIVEALISRDLSSYTSDLNVWARMGNSYELLKGCKRPDMHALQNKKPIGVIVMVLMDSDDPLEAITSFVSPAIAFGNVIIVVTTAEIASELRPLTDCFLKCLPEGVLGIIEGFGYASFLATDKSVNAIGVCTDRKEIMPEVQELKNIAVLNFKRFWVQPSIERSMSEYPRRFLKEQTIFLAKIIDSAEAP